MSREEMRRALGDAPLPNAEAEWSRIRARVASGPARSRRVPFVFALASCVAAVLVGVAGGTYWKFAAPSSWTVVGGGALDTTWTEAAGDTMRLEVGRIGQVALAPGSRARLRRGGWNEHRLELERGSLQAVIAAPPRLFFVETPTAVATDLGCAYELEVLPEGGTSLYVTVGWVSLSKGETQALVPAGLRATVGVDGAPSVPYDPELSTEARDALLRLAGGSDTGDDLDLLLAALDALDATRPVPIRQQTSGITLWHLISRVAPAERSRLIDALESRAPMPSGVRREGILALDRQMLDRWRRALHPMWGEDSSPIVALAQRLWLSVMD